MIESHDTPSNNTQQDAAAPAAATPNRGRIGWWLAGGLTLVTLIALMCGNIWIMNQQLNRISRTSKQRHFWIVCHNESSPEEKKAALMALIANGNTEWRSADFSQLNLEDSTLQGVVLTYANFRYASFANSDLSKSDLSYCVLTAANFDDCDLTGAVLIEADLLKAQLSNAILRNGNLRGISLDQATVKNASLVLADMSESHLLMADFTGSDFTGTDLRSANLEAAILADTNLALTHLGNANLESTDFTNANWWRARGLDSEQIEELRSKFSPNKEASKSIVDDFELWSLSTQK